MIRDAAPLHDIGKVGISRRILLKPGKLTPAEWIHMTRHVEIGARILGSARSPALRLAAEIARTHHERWDGDGYIAGLAGEDIPLAGRITALADVFDMLTHERPYKPAWESDRALAEIHGQAGAPVRSPRRRGVRHDRPTCAGRDHRRRSRRAGGLSGSRGAGQRPRGAQQPRASPRLSAGKRCSAAQSQSQRRPPESDRHPLGCQLRKLARSWTSPNLARTPLDPTSVGGADRRRREDIVHRRADAALGREQQLEVLRAGGDGERVFARHAACR